MHDTIRHLLLDIFNHDFTQTAEPDEFYRAFFARPLALGDLKKISACVAKSRVSLDGHTIPAAMVIPGATSGKLPFAIVAQLHGNEPAGCAGLAMAMALSQAGVLTRDVIGVIGNPLAAAQYFEAWSANPGARQETRDCYRSGLDKDGRLLPDMNRIPVDFMEQDPSIPHIKRAQELYAVGRNICGIADLHSARGDMVCITDYRDKRHLKDCPIRAVLTGLADAIAAHASAKVAVRTLKGTLLPLPNLESQTGIEAGSHEDPKAPEVAASFMSSLLSTLGISKMPPFYGKEDGMFVRYAVRPRITYADLVQEGTLSPDDRVYMAREDNNGNYVPHQYEEMEPIGKGQVVAVARPSGTLFKAPYDFSGIFVSKSAELYDKDPSVGPWPVDASRLSAVKFCYPCEVSKWPVDFKH